MNLPEIKKNPVVVETSVGAIAVNFDSLGFFTWFHDGEKATRWSDGRAMLRAALSERGRLADATDPAGAIVEGLNNDEIEGAATQVLAATAEVFVALDDEPTASAPSEILHRRIRSSVSSTLEKLSETARKIAPDFRTVTRQLQAMAPAIALAQQQLPLALRMLQDSPTLRLIQSFRDAQPEYMRIAEAAQRAFGDTHSSLSQIQRLLSSEQLIHPFANAFSTQNLVRQYAFNFPTYSIAAQAIEAGLLLRGYQLTAFAGLEGIAGRGAAADVLSAYGEPTANNAPFFSSVRGAIEHFDLDEVPASQIETWLQQTWELAQKLFAAGVTDVKKSGIVAMLGLLLAVIALYGDLTDNGATTADVRRVEEAVQGVTRNLEDIQRDLREKRLEDRAIRYLAEDAWLRAAPTRDGLRIRRVYPDQIVRVLDESGNWLKVEVYDYGGDAPVVGWMNRRVLRVRPVE